jgi:hypothetical protein
MGWSGSGYGQVVGCCECGNDTRFLGNIVPVCISQYVANYSIKHNMQIWYNSVLLHTATCFECLGGSVSVTCRIHEKKCTRGESSTLLWIVKLLFHKDGIIRFLFHN